MRLPFLLLMIVTAATVGCVDDCPNGQCPTAPPTSPFADPVYGPGTSQPYQVPAYDHQSDQSTWGRGPLGREVFVSPATYVNHAAAAETKSGCPTCPQTQRPLILPNRPAVVPTPVQRPSAIPWQTHSVLSHGIRLNPGERLLSVGPLRPITVQKKSTTPAMPPPVSNLMPGPDRCECPDCTCANCTGPGCGCCLDCPPVQSICPTCPDAELREGAFSCQRCGRATVGDQWHEAWADDDTPLTCLCKTCWSVLNPTQRAAELIQYARGQARGNLSAIVADSIREAVQQ